MIVDTDAEIARLRALLRDLVALSAIPGGWIASEPRDVAARLVDALVGLLRLDFGFVRLCDPGGADAVEATRGDAWSGFPGWLDRHLADASFLRMQVIDDVADGGSRACMGIAVPIGVSGEGGIVVAACERESFPSDSDRLLLSLAANQAAIAFQSAKRILERTAELRRSEARLGGLLVEQRALRSVATLAAHEAPQAEIFNAVAESIGELLGAETTGLLRREPDGSAVIVASRGSTQGYEVGVRERLEDDGVATRIFRTGQPARIDDLRATTGAFHPASALSLRSVVGVPVIVEGQLWGAMIAGTTEANPMPPDTESRLDGFTELMATAIANSESRARGDRLAAAQAALRRVATLVAEDAPLMEVFAKATEEVANLIGDTDCGMCRDEGNGTVSTVGAWGEGVLGTQRVGELFPLDGISLAGRTIRERRYCQIDDYATTAGTIGELGKEHGIRSAAGCPIVVQGSVWGMIGVARYDEDPLPPETEARLAQLAGLVATAIANADARAATSRLTEEQAALRNVATLVAGEAPQAEVFSAIAEQIAHVLGMDEIRMLRYDDDHSAVVVGCAGNEDAFPLGSRQALEGDTAAVRVLRTGRTARIDNYQALNGPLATTVRSIGVRSAVGAPIVVEGRAWGAIVAGATQGQPLPPGTEWRLGQFTELMATAIANAEARSQVQRLAEQQAALRRVATLVAQGVSPDEVFSVVSDEVGRLFGSDEVGVGRYEPDGSGVVFVGVSHGMRGVRIGTRWPLADFLALTTVYRTGRSATRERSDYEDVSGPVAESLREMNFASRIAAPIIVEGNLWGVMTVNDAHERLAPDAEERVAKFTELVATAIANADGRDQLTASRARIVTAADEARRRIERDLHDGVQQKLVSLLLKLRSVERTVVADDPLAGELGEVDGGLDGVIEELRELSRGIHPAMLRAGGLDPAIRGLARRSGVPVALNLALHGPLAEPVEVAAYYVVSEALTNAAKHARATRVEVAIESRAEMLNVRIRDDGVGGADAAPNSGLTGLQDRVEALGGTITLTSPPGQGTLLHAAFPLGAKELYGEPDEQAERDSRR